MSDAITIPYDPESVINEWGWLWEDDEDGDGEWMLICTAEDADDADKIITQVWDADGMSADARGIWDAATLKGQPYLPLSRPACEPGAGLLVTVRLPGGASIAHSWGKPCARADRARALVLAALDPSPRAEEAKE